MMSEINQILIECANNPNLAREKIKKLTKQNFTLNESDGSLFIEFDDPSDQTDFGYNLSE